jgi:DUF438 domain-containing protein
MKAMRNFIAEVKKLKKGFVNPDQEFFSFMDKLIPSDHWKNFHFDKAATKKETWIYLHSLGCGVVKIRKVTGGSPNEVAEVIKEYSSFRHYADNESMNTLIEAWKPYRALIPDEFFIRYLGVNKRG